MPSPLYESPRPQSLADCIKRCNFRRVRTCDNCKWYDDFSEDYCDTRVFCGNPKTDFEDAEPGEQACIDLSGGVFVCDNWEEKEISNWDDN